MRIRVPTLLLLLTLHRCRFDKIRMNDATYLLTTRRLNSEYKLPNNCGPGTQTEHSIAHFLVLFQERCKLNGPDATIFLLNGAGA